MNATGFGSAEQRDVLRTARSVWRRAGVRRADRDALIGELSTELAGAERDGHPLTAVLGDDSTQMLASWADERGVSGRALRLGSVVPAAILGIACGMSLILVALYAAFSGRANTFEPGPFTLAFYATGGTLGYLTALVCVGLVLRFEGDPHTTATVRRLAALLPIGAALCIAGGVAIAAWRDFNTSPSVFVAVIGAVLVGLTLTVACSRYLAVRSSPSHP
jgi:hypothetical protein